MVTGKGVMQGDFSIGEFVLINTLLYQVFQPLNLASHFYGQIKRALLDIQLMLNLLKNPVDIFDKTPAIAKYKFEKAIRFENLNFSYVKGKKTINNLSFTVPFGKTLAIVGLSGSGKSTVAKLLWRFYDADEGRIFIDDVDHRDLQLSSLRNLMSIVSQDTHLFNHTILFNLSLGRSFKESEIIFACQQAGIYSFILGLPDQFNTEVGERGLLLSGGEKQRLGIARALLRNSPIVLLDESTSSLDVYHEKQIIDSICLMQNKKTLIIISHRLFSIKNADNIIVLQNGELCEQGDHQSLLNLSGVYYQLWKVQVKQNADGFELDKSNEKTSLSA